MVTTRRRHPSFAGLGWGYRIAITVILPLLRLVAGRDWRGVENLPAEGGAVVVANHVTYLDPLTAGHFVWNNGRVMRYLAKSGLWRNKLVGALLTSAGQIPVERGKHDAARAYDAAVAAVRRGEVVMVFPEGTLTRDPGLWPMRGKTGAARIALVTGCPVIPLGQWGAQAVLPRYRRRLRLWPRRTVSVWAGRPVPLDDLLGQPIDAALLQVATDRIMAALTAIVADQRGETPPARLYDPKEHGVPETGKLPPDVSGRSAGHVEGG